MHPTQPILDDLPSGYFVDESPRGVLALHVDVAQALHGVGYGPEHDGQLRLADISPQIYEVFAITKLNKLFEIHETASDAAGSFS